MYLLMNKNVQIGQFDIDETQHRISYPFESFDNLLLPIGFQNIRSWVENRRASKHNSHLRKIMDDCGCSTLTGFIKVTHAASINDTFWIKKDTEDASWEQVSFYRNPFDEVISRLAFEGLGLYGLKLSSTSPELCTDGSFRKCWIRDDVEDKIFLYKRGSDGARNAGFEPYCEVMASELAREILGKDAVSYSLVHLHGELASRCELFSNEKFGYTPASRFPDLFSDDVNALMRFYGDLGSEDMFRKMIVLDALTFNTDRHAGNHGVIVDNDTERPIRMAPVFDLNLSMLPYLEESDVEHIGDFLDRYKPYVGHDFTWDAQSVLTPEIRTTLINLKGFQFSFRGDERFPVERVCFMESLIDRQIDAILSKEKLYTADVFPSETKEREREENKPTKEMIFADKLWIKYNFNLYFSAYDLDDNRTVLYLKNVPNKTVLLNLGTGEATAYIDEVEVNALDLFRQKNLSVALDVVQRAYTEETGKIAKDTKKIEPR